MKSVYDDLRGAIRGGGFGTYKMSVKVAAAMNRTFGTKFVMSNVTKGVAQFARIMNVVGWAWLAIDVLGIAFGSSHGRAFTAVNQILNQRLLLGAEGIDIADYY